MDRSVLYVLQRPCKQCLYSRQKIVSDVRRDEIIADCARTEQNFTCHVASAERVDAVCHGHWTRNRTATLRNRLAVVWQRVCLVSFEALEGRAAQRKAARRARKGRYSDGMTLPVLGERNPACDCPLCRAERNEPPLKPGEVPKQLLCFDALHKAAKEEPRDAEAPPKPANVDENGVVQGELE